MYSGHDTSENCDNLPEVFNSFYQYMLSKDNKYNQVIANWYEKDYDSIAKHSDCTKGWIENGNVAIISIYNLQENNKENQILEITPKQSSNTKSL